MLFRRPSVRYGRTPEPETPYQKAAQAWDERIGAARVQARNWRLIVFGNLFVAAGLAGGLIWQAARGTVAGAGVLSWSGQPTLSSLFGPLAIIGACIAWGLDNNLTRKVSLADPMQIVELKGLVAGPVNVGLGLWMGDKLPGITTIVATGMVGFLCYGVSLVLFVIALRHLGSARTSAYFSTAPFFGATAAILALNEPITLPLVIAAALMGLGVWLHVSERHQHAHDHEPVTHSHAHTHDEHHRHAHGPEDPPGEPHVHEHRHTALEHTHPHMPDMHHQHRH
jgi:hypothetical protein